MRVWGSLGRPGSCPAPARFSPRAQDTAGCALQLLSGCSDAERAAGHAGSAGDGTGRTLCTGCRRPRRARAAVLCSGASDTGAGRSEQVRALAGGGQQRDAAARSQARVQGVSARAQGSGSRAGVQGRRLVCLRHWMARSRRWLACGRRVASKGAAGTRVNAGSRVGMWAQA